MKGIEREALIMRGSGRDDMSGVVTEIAIYVHRSSW